MTPETQVNEDLIRALKAHDTVRLATLRLLKAAAHNAQVAKRAPLSDDEYLDVLIRQAKLRREAAAEYERAGRPDRAAAERDELAILESYLPAPFDEAALRTIIQEAIAQTGAQGARDLGKVMSRVMPSVRGKADGTRVNQLVRELLTASS